MADKKTLQAQFEQADGARENFMNRARQCARVTHPTMLPQENITQEDTLTRSFQSLGSSMVSNVTSKLLLTVFPPNSPWFSFVPSAKALSLPLWTPATLKDFVKQLYNRQKIIQAQFDATNYRIKSRLSFEHDVGVGNSLMFCGGENGDYWYKNFRLDHYVQKRGSDGKVLWGITVEMKDPMELSDEDISKAGLPSREELEQKEGDSRNQKLYTKWIRESDGRWLIQQEINKKIIRWSLEPVSPYISSGYIELSGEDYSRGLVEEALGDLLAFDTSTKSILDWATAASKITPVIDSSQSGDMVPRDLAKPSGVVIEGTVRDGDVRGVAFLTTKMAGDMAVVLEIAANIERRLGKQFLLQSEAQRKAERVTATEVMQVAQQLVGALGSIYAQIASEKQVPMLERMIYHMERDRILVPLPKQANEMIDIEILTGLAALGQQRKLENLLAALQVVAQVPELVSRLSEKRVLSVILQGFNTDEQDLTKTDEEMEAEVQARVRAQLQAAAGEQAIKTTGAVVEESAKQQAAPAA